MRLQALLALAACAHTTPASQHLGMLRRFDPRIHSMTTLMVKERMARKGPG